MICLLRWTALLWTLNSIPCALGMAVSEQSDGSCPPLSVEERRFSDVLDRPLEITGFDLTEMFLLRKGTIAEDLPSFRLGSSPLIKPTKLIFPNGLPSEYSLVSIWRVRRTTKKDRWYLWQIFDQSGGSQVNVVVDGDKKVVEFSFQSLLRNTLRYTFKSRDLHALFDRQWHKLSISVQTNAVSIYMDCKLIERRATDERASIDPSGRTLITTRIEDGRPVDIELKQFLIYCDPYIAELENCCELQDPKAGLPGVAGLPGQKGDKGEKGNTGEAGPAGNGGPKGELGSEGQKGIDGEKGLKGDSGPVGPVGPKGTKGDTGLPGTPGLPAEKECLKGDQGLQGEKGEKGSAGVPGHPGEPGKEGKRGRRGKPGDPGPRGSPGPAGAAEGASAKVLPKHFSLQNKY
ncbi:collagen alpha-1(XIX) chain isoform X3 [Simochromis diagramma]|uniref:collagen alpha-1(XIX) chain isoform X3 n=1 Tax=Simochromis diagramma TaxID=43689 RepID=UPI001A7EB11D|nr:collagen alpha-1(XIX) chain isoform X3 [Simochromis diagramma]